MSDEPYFAHTHDLGKTYWQTMKEHASNVSRIAGENADAFGEGDRARLAGKLHDLGKYGDLFQRRLRGFEKGLDHWTAGAHVALMTYRAPELALVIQGHHIGLQKGARESFRPILEQHPNPPELRLTETDVSVLRDRLETDIGPLPTPNVGMMKTPSSASAMLDTRMIFSALVDADHLDTERTMNRGKPGFVPRPTPPELQAERALELLEKRLIELEQDERIPQKTRALRRKLAVAARDAASSDARLRTLTAPTGTGKTLGMLLFALHKVVRENAVKANRVRRIIVVLPFLSILDQTVRVYRDLFAEFGDRYILEHHSLTGTQDRARAEGDEQSKRDQQARMLAQNWDAPIVITTSVQFLESLHANRPSGCRKLHNIAGSIVLFDEVQTLPVNLAVTTLKTLSKLASDKYGCTVVFSTATQPAFDGLHAKVLEDTENAGWRPEEIVPAELGLFSSAKRVQVNWQPARTPTPWATVADWLEAAPQSLCIVNLKRHALALVQLAQARKLKGVFHLSTALCPAHRRAKLDEIRAALEAKRPCRLIATQCVEAGVDLDFPVAFRAVAPYDAIAQAAGRCNRHDALGDGVYGQLTVFMPEEEKYPPGVYPRAADVTKTLLNEFGSLDIDDPETFTRYFKRLYAVTSTDDQDIATALKTQDYVKVNEHYRLIENATVNVVVPYSARALELMAQAANEGIDGKWMREARAFTVSVYCNDPRKLPPHLFEPVLFRFGKRAGETAPDWFICRATSRYDDLYGFLPEAKEGNPAFYTA